MSKAAELAALIGSGQAQGDKNFVINGAMQINQRGSSTGVTNAGSGYHGPDRYKFNEDGTMTAVVSIERETLTSGNAFDDGHLYAYKLSVTTADTAVASDIYTRITHRFEKDNLALLRKGSSSAKRVTLSFWVKATVTGTNVVEFFDQVNSRQVGATYTVSSSNTWEYKTVTFPADTSGALGGGNGLAAEINFVLQAGSNYTSGTLDTSWASETTANRAAGHNSNHFSSTSNTFHFTGVQLEIGDVATPFEHEDIGTTLAKCQRYYSQYDATNGGWVGSGYYYNTTAAEVSVRFPQRMRAAASISSGGTIGDLVVQRAGTSNAGTSSISVSTPTTVAYKLTVNADSSSTAGYGTNIYVQNTVILKHDAEL